MHQPPVNSNSTKRTKHRFKTIPDTYSTSALVLKQADKKGSAEGNTLHYNFPLSLKAAAIPPSTRLVYGLYK